METSGASPPPADKNAMLSKAVYDWIIEKSGGSVVIQEPVEILFGDVGNEFTMQHAFKVGQAYPAISLDVAALSIAMSGKLTSTSQKGNSASSASDSKIPMSTIEQSFEATYLGDVDEEFKAYLLDCWEAYMNTNNNDKENSLKYPFTTIVQSSGFGKSRLLYQLALKMNGNEPMRVLYTCIRQNPKSTGFPKATTQLNDFFFPQDCTAKYIEDCLYVAFEYAKKNWETIGTQWLGLFSRFVGDPLRAAVTVERSNDPDIRKCFDDYAKKINIDLAAAKKHDPVNQSVDVYDFDQSEMITPMDDISTTDKQSHVKPKDIESVKNASKCILILAIDEARALLDENSDVDHAEASAKPSTKYRLLRQALHQVNERIHGKHGENHGIFAVLVDTNSKISDFVPPLIYDPSYRGVSSSLRLFHPFVLTHTMNIYSDAVKKGRDTIDFCRAMVVGALNYDNQAWQHLVYMGRPLWRSVAAQNKSGRLSLRTKSRTSLVTFAAKKLLLGAVTVNSSSFSEQTMNGVASMLCRLGLRPNSSTALASRVVADFMAILTYVNYTHDRYISSYFSDPILTFGAAQLWYVGEMLSSHILPQLTKLFTQEVLDTGAVGEAVARILLLMTMDACANAKANAASLARFYSVTDFIKMLRGPNIEFPIRTRDKEIELVGELDAKWEDWWIGFSHFVQLTDEPTEDCLWYLLSRRAAGVFPKNQRGADLFIPIFRSGSDSSAPRVSMILVQVKNYDSGFSNTSKAVRKLRPSFVFDSDNDLSTKNPEEVLGVIVSLRGRKPKRTYVRDRDLGEGVSSERVLIVEGVQEGSFVSSAVAEKLNLLASPWWDMMKLIDQDLQQRIVDTTKSPHVVPDTNLTDIARKPMADLLDILDKAAIDRKEKNKRRSHENSAHSEKKPRSYADSVQYEGLTAPANFDSTAEHMRTGARGGRTITKAILNIKLPPIIYFCKHPDMTIINKAILYVRRNEQTQNLRIVHVSNSVDDGGEAGQRQAVVKEFENIVTLFDYIYPKLKIDFVSVQGAFEPAMVLWISEHTDISINMMFIAQPGDKAIHRVSMLGVRVITG